MIHQAISEDGHVVGQVDQKSVSNFRENLDNLKSSLKGVNSEANLSVRDCPSLVWGRPAKSVVERPRGFKSHIPRLNACHLTYTLVMQAV